jgi:hypothetical protein
MNTTVLVVLSVAVLLYLLVGVLVVGVLFYSGVGSTPTPGEVIKAMLLWPCYFLGGHK